MNNISFILTKIQLQTKASKQASRDYQPALTNDDMIPFFHTETRRNMSRDVRMSLFVSIQEQIEITYTYNKITQYKNKTKFSDSHL